MSDWNFHHGKSLQCISTEPFVQKDGKGFAFLCEGTATFGSGVGGTFKVEVGKKSKCTAYVFFSHPFIGCAKIHAADSRDDAYNNAEDGSPQELRMGSLTMYINKVMPGEELSQYAEGFSFNWEEEQEEEEYKEKELEEGDEEEEEQEEQEGEAEEQQDENNKTKKRKNKKTKNNKTKNKEQQDKEQQDKEQQDKEEEEEEEEKEEEEEEEEENEDDKEDEDEEDEEEKEEEEEDEEGDEED